MQHVCIHFKVQICQLVFSSSQMRIECWLIEKIYCNDKYSLNKHIVWCDVYKGRKSQKGQVVERIVILVKMVIGRKSERWRLRLQQSINGQCCPVEQKFCDSDAQASTVNWITRLWMVDIHYAEVRCPCKDKDKCMLEERILFLCNKRAHCRVYKFWWLNI